MLALALHGTELRAEQLLHRITGFLRIACLLIPAMSPGHSEIMSLAVPT